MLRFSRPAISVVMIVGTNRENAQGVLDALARQSCADDLREIVVFNHAKAPLAPRRDDRRGVPLLRQSRHHTGRTPDVACPSRLVNQAQLYYEKQVLIRDKKHEGTDILIAPKNLHSLLPTPAPS